MKIAYLILAHKDPAHIGRLTRALSDSGDVYIHIDSRFDEDTFRNSVTIKNRGGISLLIKGLSVTGAAGMRWKPKFSF